MKWNTKAEAAFNRLKETLTESLELFQLDPDRPFVLRTDASEWAIGAVLEQEREGQWVPVGFFQQKIGGKPEKLDSTRKGNIRNCQCVAKMGRVDRISASGRENRSQSPRTLGH